MTEAATARVAPTEALCPACASAPQANNRSGLCEACHFDHLADDNVTRDRAAIEARTRSWQQRTAEAERAWWTERQDRHRLRKRLQPREPAPDHMDPWRIADDAIKQLGHIRMALGATTAAKYIDEVAERIRWLAVGPENIAAAVAEPEPPRSRESSRAAQSSSARTSA